MGVKPGVTPYKGWAALRFYKSGAHRISVRIGKLRCDQYVYSKGQYNGLLPRWVSDGELQFAKTGPRQKVMKSAWFHHEFTGLNPLLED